MNKDKAEILFKLYRRGIWGGRHTPLDNLYHLSYNVKKKELEQCIKELANENLILLKKSTKEIHISLNPHEKTKIKQIIMSALGIDEEILI